MQRNYSPAKLGFFVLLGVGSAALAAQPGRDFVPNDWASSGSLEIDGANEFTLIDAFRTGRYLWVVWTKPLARHPGLCPRPQRHRAADRPGPGPGPRWG